MQSLKQLWVGNTECAGAASSIIPVAYQISLTLEIMM
jgi:hypothetical protein